MSQQPPPQPQPKKLPLGESPGAMLNRKPGKDSTWCPRVDIESDPYCDTVNPVAVTYKHIMKTLPQIRQSIPDISPIRKSRCCEQFGCELYYKIEIFNKTGSFEDRAAVAVLQSLTLEQKDLGVVTCSWGNFGVAMAYFCKLIHVPIRIVFPKAAALSFVWKCKDLGAKTIIHGENYKEAKRQAHVIAKEKRLTFINGYDHPAVIAGSGSIGVEIMEQLPETDVIIVPVGGGGLIAGITEAVRHYKNGLVQTYGVEPDKCCSFFKAMDKDGVFETEAGHSVATCLSIPMAGCNSFHTAKSLISKMILVDDNWITRAVSHLAEEERLVVEGAGAIGLSVLFAMPKLVPELQHKTVVVVLTGSNFGNILTLPKCLYRTKAIDGRLVKFSITIIGDDMDFHTHILSMIANTGGNLEHMYREPAWISENDIRKVTLQFQIQCTNIEHACQIKRVLNKLFPNQCTFVEEPFSPAPVCICYPKKPYQPLGTSAEEPAKRKK